jgi:putative ABC transport system permease protein
MKGGIVDIELWRLIAAYIFVVFLIVFVKIRKISREKQIILASFRMTLQLVLAGFVLILIFKHPNPFVTILFIIGMEIFAVTNIFKQLDVFLRKESKLMVAFAMVGGSLLTLVYFNFVVIHFSPWYEPRYFISIAGMIVGNSMTALTLGLINFLDGLRNQREIVEGSLLLGATPKDAVKPFMDRAFDSAILPTLNNMLGMGIVFLPGMMSGQILSGISPLVAIEYQIAILLGILGSTTLTVMIFIVGGYQSFFSKDAQILPLEDKNFIKEDRG